MQATHTAAASLMTCASTALTAVLTALFSVVLSCLISRRSTGTLQPPPQQPLWYSQQRITLHASSIPAMLIGVGPRLAWWLLDMCIVNAFQLWAIGKDTPRQLHFREELMRSLVKLFGSNREAVQASRGANAGVTLVKDHYADHSEEERDCVVCSQRPAHRVRTRSICAKCHVHLCSGACFKQYHSLDP